ncbi:MAG: GTPase RsgA [Acidimicrobiales bacterium]
MESGAVPVVVLTKADLHPDPEGLADRLTVALRGVDVIPTSVIDGRGDGIDEVAARLAPGRTGVVLGLSGAGKSSLLNAGRRGAHGHRRRARRRSPGPAHHHQPPAGGAARGWHAHRSARSAGARVVGRGRGCGAAFDDVDGLAADCRFADCAHEREPDCAVRLAIEDGRLDAERLARWRKLAREAQVAARRQDPALDAAHRAEVRRVARSRRNDPRTRRKR